MYVSISSNSIPRSQIAFINCQRPILQMLGSSTGFLSLLLLSCYMSHVSPVVAASTVNSQLATGLFWVWVFTYLSDLCRPLCHAGLTVLPVSPMTQPPSELQKCKFKLVFGRVNFLNWFFTTAFCSVFSDKFGLIQEFIHVQQFPPMMPLSSHLC